MRTKYIIIGENPDDTIERAPANGMPGVTSESETPNREDVRLVGGEFERNWNAACLILRRARNEVRQKYGRIIARSAEQEVFGR